MTSQRSVVFADPVRTAIGTFGGSLKDVPAPTLGAAAIVPLTTIQPWRSIHGAADAARHAHRAVEIKELIMIFMMVMDIEDL